MSQPAPDYTDRGPLNRPLCPHGQRYYCSKCPDLPPPMTKTGDSHDQ